MSSKDALDIDHSVQLSDATLSALQINQQPFAPLGPDSASFLDETTTEQLADVKQALITGDDLLLILGASGAGKTVLLKQLGENSGLRIQCFAVKGSPRFSTLNLFAGMLEAFKRPPPENLKDILDELIPCLQTMVSRNTLSAIVLDDAHRVTETELTQLLSGMLYLNSQDETLLRVALAAPAEFEDRIPDLLPEGADLPYSSLTIDGLNPARATDYLGYRLDSVGFSGEWPFSDRDIDNLVAQSGGLPGPLHAVTATSLNQRYGPVDHIMPDDLVSEKSESLMQSRVGKLALGVLATVLIVGGLSMFLPDKSDTGDARYSADSTASAGTTAEDNTLRLVETKPVTVSAANPDISTTHSTQEEQNTAAPSSATDSADASTNASNLAAVSDAVSESSSPQATESPAEANETDENSESANTVEAETTVTIPDPEPTPVVIVAQTDTPSETPTVPDADATTSADTASEPSAPTDTASAVAESDDSGTEPETGSALIDESVADVDPELVGVLESPTWILVQDASLFTVQMSASRDRESVENFLKRNTVALPAPNSIYTFERDGATWYALLNGLYPSINEARAAVESMPSSALTNQPWIRSVGRVQDALRNQ